MTLGEAIKRLRGATGMTQLEFARKIGVTNVYVSLIESGQRVPSAKVMGRILKETKQSPTELDELLRRYFA